MYNTTNVPKSKQSTYTYRKKFNNTARETLCGSAPNYTDPHKIFLNIDTAYDHFIDMFTDKWNQVYSISKLEIKQKTDENHWITKTLKSLS